jgi:hypothetical protein
MNILDTKKLSMEWVEAIEYLMGYFRVENQGPCDSIWEVVVDERLELKIIHLEGRFLAFFGYFTGEIRENDGAKLKHILRWNFARIADSDDAIAIESETNRLYLFRKKLLSELFTDNIFAEAESFVTNLAFWADAYDYSQAAPRGSNLTVFGF